MSRSKTAKANVPFIRQETQFSCMAASLSACLRALGKDQTEADVNRIMGAGPLRGATWESLTGAAQYFGMRSTLVVPATLTQVKNWTDRGIPVVIAYNPEGRPWSHASVVYDVTGEGEDTMIHVMDPNIPDPDRHVRVYKKADFYKIWSEKVGDSIIIRRPACAIEREITPEGRQVMASVKTASKPTYRLIHDLAGIGGLDVAENLSTKERQDALSFIVQDRIRTPRNPYTKAHHQELDDAQESLISAGLLGRPKVAEGYDCLKDYRAGLISRREYEDCVRRFDEDEGYRDYSRRPARPADPKAKMKAEALTKILARNPNTFLRSIRDQLLGGASLSPKQNAAVLKFLRDPDDIVLFGGTPKPAPAPKPPPVERPAPVKNVALADADKKIQILDRLIETGAPDARQVAQAIKAIYEAGRNPTEDELKRLRNMLYKSRMRAEADFFRVASPSSRVALRYLHRLSEMATGRGSP